MNILLTGSSGFIGQALTPILTNHNVHHLASDLLDYDNVTNEVLAFAPDIIIHLGARTEVEKSFYEQTTFSEVNYVGSINLIEAAAKIPNFKNFIFASTMEVYGWQPISDKVVAGTPITESVVFDENTQPQPNAPYAVAKYAVEKYLEYVSRAYDFPYTIIRQTNAYGRIDNDFFVTEQIISQMLANSKVINLGYKEPYRNFIHVLDLLDAWSAIIKQSDTIPKGKIFTLGPNNPIKISDYADLIAKKLNWHGIINWDTKPERPGEIYWLNSDHKLITELTGWKPKITLSNGLDKTIQHWRDSHD